MGRRVASLIIVLCLLLGLSGCGAKPVQETQFVMGTVVSYTLYGANAAEQTELGMKLLTTLEERLSANLPDSDVGRYNAGETDALGPDAGALLQRAEILSTETGGAFTPWLGAVTQLWGFSSEEPRCPSDAELEAALTARPQLDLGGIAKGYAADQLRILWEEAGVKYAIATLGGNVVALGTKPDGTPWRVGIRDPFGGQSDLLGTLAVTDTSVVTSGGYERQFTQDGTVYHHILDPETGVPARSGLASVTVVCRDSTRADALSTALFVLGKDAALELWKQQGDFQLILVEENGTVTVTDGLWDAFTGTGEDTAYVRAE